MGISSVSRKTIVTLALCVVAVAGIGTGYYFYAKYRTLVQNPEIVTQREVDWLKTKIGRLILLPDDENPSVATVLNKDGLQEEAFFKKAENGDKILIYEKNLRAYLYRPSTNILIEVMSITAGTAQDLAASQNLKIAVYNGSEIPDASTKTAQSLREKISNVEIVLDTAATRFDYNGIMVVDLSGDKANHAETIAQTVGGKVGDLPEGEDKPDADILIIVGN